jgi:hypothetical protein
VSIVVVFSISISGIDGVVGRGEDIDDVGGVFKLHSKQPEELLYKVARI